MAEPRSVDPTSCWVRHVVRGENGEPSAFELGNVYFVRDDVVRGEDGLNGRQGWQAGEVTAVLSDDGSFKIMLPNDAGDDGVLHRRRFAALTSEDYEPGEEWLEFYRDPNDVIYIGTPTTGEKTRSTVTISGGDPSIVLAGSLSSEVDVWDAAAPADVLAHYLRMAVLIDGEDLAEPLSGGVGAWGAAFTRALPATIAPDCWTMEARLRWTSARPTAKGQGAVRLEMPATGVVLVCDAFEGDVTVEGVPGSAITAKLQGLVTPGPVDLRVVVRYDHVFLFVAGELVAEFLRQPPWLAPNELRASVFGGAATLDGIHVESLAAFLGGGQIDRALPGIPPATGLRGQYWNAAPTYAQNTTQLGRVARLWGVLAADAAVDRRDPRVNFPAGTASYPPNLPGAYAARWSGAVLLNLAAADRHIRLSGLVGNARVYVGRTLRDQPAASSWFSASVATLTTASLREWLGTEESGWYPIVVEQTVGAAEAGIVLEDSEGGGAFSVIPQERLSPIGVYSNLVRLTTHRQVVGDVAQAFGYQWRAEPQPVESGNFPGWISAKALIGRQTDVVIDEDGIGTEAQVQDAAEDVVDGLVVDAAGLADPTGSGQLSAQVVDYERARGHMALRQGYESLSDITEAPLLQTRADSLLALRSSPNEQVGVRPQGQRDLTDTFPLTGVLARMDWLVGDAPRLELDAIDVIDESPRQITTITWGLVPDGVGVPTVGFRQRPRTPRAALKRLANAIYAPRRTYQGNIATMNGTVGGVTSAGATLAWTTDGYSRAPLPENLDDVVKVIAAVQVVTGTGWRLEVSGVDLGASGLVSAVGNYDVTDAAKAAALGAPLMLARLIAGASGQYQISLVVWVKV